MCLIERFRPKRVAGGLILTKTPCGQAIRDCELQRFNQMLR